MSITMMMIIETGPPFFDIHSYALGIDSKSFQKLA